MPAEERTRTVAPWARVSILVVTLGAGCALSYALTGTIVPTAPADALIFQSTLLFVVLGSASSRAQVHPSGRLGGECAHDLRRLHAEGTPFPLLSYKNGRFRSVVRTVSGLPAVGYVESRTSPTTACASAFPEVGALLLACITEEVGHTDEAKKEIHSIFGKEEACLLTLRA